MNYFNNELLVNIKSEFSEITLEYKEIELGGIVPAFFINLDNESILREKWSQISEYIAIHFQSTLKNEYSIWNIYLFFILKEEVSSEIKYRIENDTFSSRKIVISPIKDIKTIIRENIINDDLNINEKEKSTFTFTYNDIIWKALSDVGTSKKKTKNHTEKLNEIIKQLKDISL